jgi:hypothetical protein
MEIQNGDKGAHPPKNIDAFLPAIRQQYVVPFSRQHGLQGLSNAVFVVDDEYARHDPSPARYPHTSSRELGRRFVFPWSADIPVLGLQLGCSRHTINAVLQSSTAR